MVILSFLKHKKNPSPLWFAFILFLQISNVHAQSGKDTLAISAFIDSVTTLNQPQQIKLDPLTITSKIEVLKKYKPSTLITRLYGLYTGILVRTGDKNKARLYLDTCYTLAKKMNNPFFLAETKYTEGIYLKFNGKSDQAIQNWFDAMAVFKKEMDVKKEISCLAAIAKEYLDMKQPDKAEFYLKEVIETRQKIGDEKGVSYSYNTLANVYLKTNRYSDAITLFNKAIEISSRLKDTVNLAYTYNNLANAYNKMDRLADAISNWSKSFELFKSTGDAYGIAMITNNMAYGNIKLKNYKKGVEYAKAAVTFSEEHGIDEELERAHSNLLDAYYGLNDFKNGFKEYEIIVDMKDARFNKDVANAVADAEQKYKTKIQQDSITILNAEKKVNALLLDEKENESKAYRNWLFIVTLSAGLVGVLGFTAFNRYRLRQKLRLSEAINQQQKQSIKAVIEAQEEERKRIGSELHDSVGQKLGALKLHLQGNTPPEALNELLNNTISETRSISHRLMPVTLSNFGLNTALKELLQTTLPVAGVQYDYFNKDENRRFTETVEISVYRVCQELISNLIKHSKAKLFHLQIYVQNNQLMIIAEDDGIGLKNPKENGMGILNMQARIQQLNGIIRFEKAHEEKGLLTTIKIPV
ncbi:MAG: tetratricopeptide repeat protein [Sediminibacterium sp.]|nr:tetratricopeptide repeat protein [Sediminibacterium sp.]